MYNHEKYKKMLFSPEIPYDEITSSIKPPPKLYKFQNFYNEDGKENPYWKRNMQGEFHTSLGKEFEDINDCRPRYNKIKIIEMIKNHLVDNNKIKFEQEIIKEMIEKEIEKILDSSISEQELDEKIPNNYRSKIRIGCFTDSSDNLDMWEKYSDERRGYCIEYNTSKHILFQASTLPVLYLDKLEYDSSRTFADSFVLDMKEYTKKCSLEENLPKHEKILKTSYIPIFIKNSKWSFEREYRMFILEHRTTNRFGETELLKMNNLLNKNANLDLSKAIEAIYLGEHFEKNKNYKELLENVFSITENKKIPLFIKKKEVNGVYENIKIDTSNINNI